MNILVSGPFGGGSLSDELLLASLLTRLRAARHELTVLTEDAGRTRKLHGDVPCIQLASPKQLVSCTEAWRAIEKSHVFLLAGAGVLSDAGDVPARFWLGQMEGIQKLHVKCALIGCGAHPVADPRERVRLQRYLHHFCDTVGVRDELSKRCIVEYGLSANRVSANGSPVLALAPKSGAVHEAGRTALIFSSRLPVRNEFGIPEAGPDTAARTAALAQALHSAGRRVLILHDASHAEADAVAALQTQLSGLDVTLMDADTPHTELVAALSRCEHAVSFSIEGIALAAACGVPVAGFSAEPGANELLTSLGLLDAAITEPENAGLIARVLAALTPARAAGVAARAAGLARKEAQNLRALDALVPRRVVRDKAVQLEQLARETAPEDAADEAPRRSARPERAKRGPAKRDERPRRASRPGRREREERNRTREAAAGGEDRPEKKKFVPGKRGTKFGSSKRASRPPRG